MADNATPTTSTSNSSDVIASAEAGNTDSSTSIVGASSEAELEGAMEAQGLTEPEKKQQRKKYKLKVDGNEETLDLDLSNEQEVIKHLQMSRVAQKRMEESAKMKKQQDALQGELQEFFKLLKANPEKVLSDPSIGVDLKKFAQDIINKEIEEASKSPEQKAQEQRMKEFEDLKKEKENLMKQAENERMARIQHEYSRQIDDEITDALKATDMPKKPYIVKRIAEQLSIAIENGMNDITVKDIIPIVERQYRSDLKEMFDSYPEEILESLLGDANVERLRKHRLKKLRKPIESMKNVKEVTKEASTDKEGTKVKTGDFFRNL